MLGRDSLLNEIDELKEKLEAYENEGRYGTDIDNIGEELAALCNKLHDNYCSLEKCQGCMDIPACYGLVDPKA